MIYRQHVNVKTSTKLLFLIILMIIYVGFDVLSSASAGNDNSERTRVYIVLFAIMLIMFFDLLLKPHISYDGYPVLIAIYAIYYVLNLFILKLEIEWHAISNLAIVVWWFLTCLYFRNAMISSHDLFRSIYQFMFVMFYWQIKEVKDCFVFEHKTRIGILLQQYRRKFLFLVHH